MTMDVVSFFMLGFGVICLIASLCVFLYVDKIRDEAELIRNEAQQILQQAKEKGNAAIEQLVSAVRENSETLTKAAIEESDVNSFKGFPVAEKSPKGVFAALKSHGFRFHWNNHNYREIGINYQDPKNSEGMLLREVYAVPVELMPANALHDERRADAALWAARKFKEDRCSDAPELAAFPYL